MTTKELSLKKGDAMFSSFEKIFKQLGNAVALVYCLLIILHGCDYFTVYCKKTYFSQWILPQMGRYKFNGAV